MKLAEIYAFYNLVKIVFVVIVILVAFNEKINRK